MKPQFLFWLHPEAVWGGPILWTAEGNYLGPWHCWAPGSSTPEAHPFSGLPLMLIVLVHWSLATCSQSYLDNQSYLKIPKGKFCDFISQNLEKTLFRLKEQVLRRTALFLRVVLFIVKVNIGEAQQTGLSLWTSQSCSVFTSSGIKTQQAGTLKEGQVFWITINFVFHFLF